MYDVHGCIQEVAINSKNLSHAHVQAADILTELYGNLKEDQVLMVQMSSAIWRKVSIIFLIIIKHHTFLQQSLYTACLQSCISHSVCQAAGLRHLLHLLSCHTWPGVRLL